MNNEELERLIKEDVPCIPQMEYDTKKILQDCKRIEEEHIKKMKRISRIAVLVIPVLLFSIFVVVTLVFPHKTIVSHTTIKNNTDTYGMSPDIGKDAEGLIYLGYVDYVVAYGLNSQTHKYKSSILYDLDLISTDDIKTLRDMDAKNGIRHINLYFAVKDNKDIIVVSYLEQPYGDEGTLIFDSNLKFKFDDLIKEFEGYIGESLTRDFLNQRYQDNQEELIPSGIYLELYDDNNGYGIKFTLYYNTDEYNIYK